MMTPHWEQCEMNDEGKSRALGEIHVKSLGLIVEGWKITHYA
jgi:hypothetical protein